LRLLDRTLRDERLEPAEAKAVASYLLAHVPPFSTALEGQARDSLLCVLEESQVRGGMMVMMMMMMMMIQLMMMTTMAGADAGREPAEQ
jgi:hypothetical protein